MTTMRSIFLTLIVIGLSFGLSKNDFKPSPRSRGEYVDPHTIPYMVLMQVLPVQDKYCGGTLISQNYVLTSASCTISARGLLVYLGAHFVSREEVGKIIIPSQEIIYHESYSNYTNDIAVVKLSETIEYSDTIKPVILPKKSDIDTNYQGVTARVSGWGGLWEDFGIFEIPRYCFVDVLSNDDPDCHQLSNPLPDSILCTSGEYEGASTGPTIGDEGGPLILNGVLIGIISFGYEEWWSGYSAAYTRVASYLDWIEANTDVVIS